MEPVAVGKCRSVRVGYSRKQGHLLMGRIVEKLTALDTSSAASPLEASFRVLFAELLELVDQHVATSMDPDRELSCSAGCCDCCSHWVEDVNSFEAQIIDDFVRVNMPWSIDTIRQACAVDCRELERLGKMVDEKLRTLKATAGVPPTDPVDLLLNIFYQMRRPCPLLSDDGTCMIYPVRPLTCRIYVSTSDPLRCNPDYIHASSTSTLIIDLSEEANRILDRLHFKFQRYDGDTGLRSLLLKHLSLR